MGVSKPDFPTVTGEHIFPGDCHPFVDRALFVPVSNNSMALEDAFTEFTRRDWDRDAPDGTISIASLFGGVVPQEIVVESGDVRREYTGPWSTKFGRSSTTLATACSPTPTPNPTAKTA